MRQKVFMNEILLEEESIGCVCMYVCLCVYARVCTVDNTRGTICQDQFSEFQAGCDRIRHFIGMPETIKISLTDVTKISSSSAAVSQRTSANDGYDRRIYEYE